VTAKVYAVVNRKGGVGKTTTAVSLAHGLTLAGPYRVLLVDLDPQGNCATALGLKTNGRPDIAELLVGSASLKDVIIPADREGTGGPKRDNLFVIPSSDKLERAKKKLVAQAALAAIDADMGGDNVALDDIFLVRLAPVTKVFDYIIFDCPPSLDSFSTAVYAAATGAIVPVKTDFLGANGTAQHTDNIVEAQANGLKIKIAAVVPTFYRPREVLARQIMTSLKKRYGARVVTPIPQSVQVEQSPAASGQTIHEYAPDSPAAAAYMNLVQFILKDKS